MIEIKVPSVGESISEVTLLKWNKKDGDYVERDEVIAELESEKATFEVNAEQAGVIKLGSINEGDTIKIGDLLASIDDKAAKPEGKSEKKTAASQEPKEKVATQESKEKVVSQETKADSKEPASNGQATSEVKASPVA